MRRPYTVIIVRKMKTRVCLAGATGWAGSALARAIVKSDDLELVSGVSARNAGKSLEEVSGVAGSTFPLSAAASEALKTQCDVFVEYTDHNIAKQNVLTAISQAVSVVIGTSGITDEEFSEIHDAALQQHVGVLAVGNFSMPALLLHKCAELAAKHLKTWEIIDYASAAKKDAPSGTVLELANRLSKIRKPQVEIPIHNVEGVKETRGASLHGMQVHSLRLPGFVISAEVIFGELDQRLSIRYDAGSSPDAYVPGALLAIRNVHLFTGLRRGLDSIIAL
jgi:4-hydroxy-tetrahydrodipicolinate reductase